MAKLSCPALGKDAEKLIVAGYKTCPGRVANVKEVAVTWLTCTATLKVFVAVCTKGGCVLGTGNTLTLLIVMVAPNETVPVKVTTADATPPSPLRANISETV
jgi:hypothetical protein